MISNSGSEDLEKQIINKFHSSLLKEIKTKNSTLEQFFGLVPRQQTCPIAVFVTGLRKLERQLNENEINTVVNKYRNQYDSSVISINILDSDLNNYYNDEDNLEVPVVDNITSKITGAIMDNNPSSTGNSNKKYVNDTPQGASRFPQNTRIDGGTSSQQSYPSGTQVNPKFEKLNQRMIQEAKETKEYKIAEIYYQFNTTQSNSGKILKSLQNKFEERDIAKNGTVTLNDFNDITENLLILSVEQKTLLTEDVKPESNGMILYKKFIDKVYETELSTLKKIIKEYDKKHNDYVIKIKNSLKTSSVQLNDIWSHSFHGQTTVNREDFSKMITNNKNLFKIEEDEARYIFGVLSNDGETLDYRTFDRAMRDEISQPNSGRSILETLKKETTQINKSIKEGPSDIGYDSSMVNKVLENTNPSMEQKQNPQQNLYTNGFNPNANNQNQNYGNYSNRGLDNNTNTNIHQEIQNSQSNFKIQRPEDNNTQDQFMTSAQLNPAFDNSAQNQSYTKSEVPEMGGNNSQPQNQLDQPYSSHLTNTQIQNEQKVNQLGNQNNSVSQSQFQNNNIDNKNQVIQPPYGQQSFSDQPSYGQQFSSGQQPSYGQPSSGQQPPYRQQSSYGDESHSIQQNNNQSNLLQQSNLQQANLQQNQPGIQQQPYLNQSNLSQQNVQQPYLQQSNLGQSNMGQPNVESRNLQQPNQEVKEDDFKPHAFYLVRTSQKMNEILSTPDEKRKMEIVTNRFKLTSSKIQEILNLNEKYIVYNLYYYIRDQFQNWGQEPLKRFIQKDPEGKQKVNLYDFFSVLRSFGLAISEEHLSIMLESLKIKTNKYYSYEEFLKNVKNISIIDSGQVNGICRTANLLFNDYVNDFHHFIVDNNVNYEAHYKNVCKNMTIITIEYFIKFCLSMNYNLSHDEEYKYLYINLSDDGKQLKQEVLYNFIKMPFTSEKEFIESGRLKQKKGPVNTDHNEWKKNIKKFTENSEILYKKNYQHLTNVFQQIDNQLTKNYIHNIIDYFDDVSDAINQEGEMPIPIFEKKMTNIGICSSLAFQSMINTFKNAKMRTFKLADFISIYTLFFPIIITGNNPANIEPQNMNQQQNVGQEQQISQPIKSPNDQILKSPNQQKTQIVFENRRKKFTQSEVDALKETFKDMADLIVTDKEMTIPDFVKSLDRGKDGFITLNDFKDFMNENYEIDRSMDDFFTYLLSDEIVGGEEVIHVDWLIKNLIDNAESTNPVPQQQVAPQNNTGTQKTIFLEEKEVIPDRGGNVNAVPLNNQGMISQALGQSSLQSRPLKPGERKEDQLIKTFSLFLETNKIRFSQIFPSSQSSLPDQFITDFEFKRGFKAANYNIDKNDFNLLLLYFDPIGKEKIKVSDLKNEIAKYAPTYFNQQYQSVINDESYKTQSSIQVSQTLTNNTALNGINKISVYLRQNKLNPTSFFQQSLKRNDVNEPITKNEFMQSLTLIQDLKPEEGSEVFEIIDNDHDEKIIFNDLLSYFGGEFPENKVAKAKLNKTMTEQINGLFNIFDANKDDMISKEDLLKAMKSVDHKATIGDVEKIIVKMNQGSNTNIDRKTFNEIMEKFIKEQLIIQEEEKEYILKLFKEADIDKVGFLTSNQLKYLLTEKLNTNLTTEEINKIVQDANIKYDELIDIEEFVKLLDGVYEKDDDNLKNTVLEIKMQRKIHPKTFISLYNGLPLNFIPSFIREEQKLLRLLPSSMLIPKKDASGILYEDIKPLIEGTNNPNNTANPTTGKNYMLPIPTKVNTKISFDYATGVSSPDETLFTAPENKLKIVGRTLKMALYNTVTNQYISNAVSIDATYKKEYQDRWYFEEDRTKFNNNIIVRYNGNETDTVIIVFEFVLIIQRENITTETSCGWCSCTMGDLYKPSEMKLQIKGGSPQKPDIINKLDVRTKRTGWGKFTSIFTGEVKSLLPVKIKPFKSLNSNDQLIIDYLPVTCLVHRASMQIVYIYRKIIGDYILNHQDYSLKVIKNDQSIVNSFCRIADCPDAFRIMTELWNEVIIEGATSDERKNEEFLKKNFVSFVNRIYSVIYSEKFKYDELDPTKVPVGDIHLMEARNNLINSVIRYDKNNKINKLNYGPVENMTSFKPFSIDEMKGEKISLVQKLDEMIPFIGEKDKEPN